ncbi:MAG: peptide chain release factor N(5)-glutamine methyltransferase [Candidatus Rokuibacteriota bacterium]
MMGAATVARLLEAATVRLAAVGVDTPRVDAEWLLAGLLGARRVDLGLLLGQEPDPGLVTRYEATIERRRAREPLQRILGWEGFRGLRVNLGPDVLVPRPETEVLVDLALALLPAPRGGLRPVVIDVGTGSGCVACAIAAERADVQVIATDTSIGALRVARDNARQLGLGQVHLAAADLMTAVAPGAADLVVSNPPYLPTALLETLAPEVRDHEPRVALDGGHDGLRALAGLVRDARRVLCAGGALVVETAGRLQASRVRELMADTGFVDVQGQRDLAGVDRFVSARASLSRGGFGGGRRGPLRDA